MNTTQLPIIVSGIIFFIAGIILIWWLTGRITRQGIRRTLRIIGLPAYVIALVVIGMITIRSQSSSLPQTEAIATVGETMTVEIGTLTQSLNATGSLAVAENTVLNFKTSAPVTELNVQVGDQVQAGDVLARVDTTALDAQVRDAELSLTQAQNALKALTAEPSDLDIKVAEASIEAAQASLSSASLTGSTDNDIQIAAYREEIAKNQLWQAQLNRDMSSQRSNPNAMNAYSNQVQSDASLAQSQLSVDQAAVNYETTASNGADASSLASGNAQLISAQAQLDSLLAGPSDTELRQAEIAVETAQLNLDAVKQAVEDAVLTAPFDGVVAEVNIAEGEMPAATGAIMLLDISHFSTTLSVDEKDIAQLKVGQTANLTIKALENVTIPATVTRIEPIPTTSSGLVTYNIEVTLNSTDTNLRPGMTTIASVILNQFNNVLVVPNRFITTDPVTNQTTVKVQSALNTYTDIPVTIGTATDSESVITSGVSVGQTLVILVDTSSSGNAGGFGLFPGGGGFAGGGGGGFPAGGGGAPPGGGNFAGGGGGRP
ncbi:MAG: HlyD family efflux transporter periplasmic adaptor subunit [Chloroflexi bacterium]|nr:HlyD family efflux transporter periplasmic adaptor subunit [Chloroflexota bacterium]MCC6891830.1 HlyD family efflux transporter periplasmic adaptor subunit [Anaerolineae bacterium]